MIQKTDPPSTSSTLLTPQKKYHIFYHVLGYAEGPLYVLTFMRVRCGLLKTHFRFILGPRSCEQHEVISMVCRPTTVAQLEESNGNRAATPHLGKHF